MQGAKDGEKRRFGVREQDGEMMTGAVFFDVGSTLLHPEPSVAETFAHSAQECGHEITVRDLESYMPQVDAFYEAEYVRDGDFWCSHERATTIWLDMYRYLAHLVGLDTDAEDIAASVHMAYQRADHWAVYPDVTACLWGLKRRGIMLGVISNWDSGLEDLLRKVKLLPYFDDVVSSAVVGYRKPDPVIFELALERMGIDAARAVHVGDLPEADGDGASAAGIRPIIVDRQSREEACGYERVEVLADIVSMV